MKTALCVIALWILTATAIRADELPRSKPEDVGLSTEKLGRVRMLVQQAVDKGQTAGSRGPTINFVKTDGTPQFLVELLSSHGQFSVVISHCCSPAATRASCIRRLYHTVNTGVGKPCY
jgi:hypothetical protein